MEVKEGNTVFDACMDNSRIAAGDGCDLRNEAEVREWLVKNLGVTVCDAFIIRDKDKVREQIARAGQIIYDGLPKIKKE